MLSCGVAAELQEDRIGRKPPKAVANSLVTRSSSSNADSSYSAYSSSTRTLKVVPKARAECSIIATNAIGILIKQLATHKEAWDYSFATH